MVFNNNDIENFVKCSGLKLPSDATHCILLDIFGRIIWIYDLNTDFESFTSEMYGNTILNNIGNKFSSQVLPLNPLGYINFDKSMLSNDQLGFPLIDIPSDSSLMPTDDLFSDTAIVGGSFVSSIFSLPGERFTDLLSVNIKNMLEKTL